MQLWTLKLSIDTKILNYIKPNHWYLTSMILHKQIQLKDFYTQRIYALKHLPHSVDLPLMVTCHMFPSNPHVAGGGCLISSKLSKIVTILITSKTRKHNLPQKYITLVNQSIYLLSIESVVNCFVMILDHHGYNMRWNTNHPKSISTVIYYHNTPVLSSSLEIYVFSSISSAVKVLSLVCGCLLYHFGSE